MDLISSSMTWRTTTAKRHLVVVTSTLPGSAVVTGASYGGVWMERDEED